MHILITGGCGYTGTLLTNDLINLWYKVTVVDTQWFGNYLLPNKNPNEKAMIPRNKESINNFNAL